MNADTSGGSRAATAGAGLGAALVGTVGDGWGRDAAYDAYADGLHTYALWYLRDHDAAADAVYCAFAAADRNHTALRQPEHIQPWLYALLRRECRQRAAESQADATAESSHGAGAPSPVAARLRPKADALGESGVGASLLQLEGNLRRAEFQSLSWAEAEGLSRAHREVLELTIRHGLDSRGLALVLGLREGAAGLAPSRGFDLLADAWRELERSLAVAAVAGSGRENCAQLAELTFGWSGKHSASLRGPLADHVDRCSRCQHYLHTVIGTPSAPTMLPYVAAPRAMRDLLLTELADPFAAEAVGVDIEALGARCGAFGGDGFPSRLDPSQGLKSQGLKSQGLKSQGSKSQGSKSPISMAGADSGSGTAAGTGRLPRRRQAGGGRPNRPQPVRKSPGAGGGRGYGSVSGTVGFTATAAGSAIVNDSEGTRTVGFTATASGSATVSGPSSPRTAPRPGPRGRDTEDVYRTEGSWAENFLPPKEAGDDASADLWRPTPAVASDSASASSSVAGQKQKADNQGSEGQNQAPVLLMPPAHKPEPQKSASTEAAASRPPTPAPAPSSAPATAPPANPGPRKEAGFVQTPSGRFANRPPARPRTAPAPSTAPAPHARHKARPMRQAVLSAMALGAIGAVAAAAATMLGASTNSNSNGSNAALDNAPLFPLGPETESGAGATTPGHDQLTVSVSTGPASAPGSTSANALGETSGGASALSQGSAAGAATSAHSGGTPASPTPTSVSSGGFYVSVNQRSADPDSVQILLRNAGTGPLKWTASPTVSWLTLSQSTGTLAAGATLSVTATATQNAPQGQWMAQIVFQPGGIVVSVHGGVPVTTPPSSTPPTTPSGGGTGTSNPTPTPTSTKPTTTPTPPATTPATPTATATATATSTGTATGTAPGGGTGAPTSTSRHRTPVRA